MKKRILTWLQAVFLLTGLVCAGTYVYVWWDGRHYQQEQKQALKQALKKELPHAAPPEVIVPDILPPPSGLDPRVFGLIEIPRVHLEAVVRKGEDDATLKKAVGWLPDTAAPWQTGGNVALAAHRDTLFRPLRYIAVNDEVLLATRRGTYRYVVESTKIVRPENVDVLAPVGYSTLTLITCYPFEYIGHAPRRFIVRARMLTRRLNPESEASQLASSASAGAVQPPASYSHPFFGGPARESEAQSGRLSARNQARRPGPQQGAP